MKRIINKKEYKVLLVLLILTSFIGCKKNLDINTTDRKVVVAAESVKSIEESVSIENCNIHKDEKFGGVMLDVSIEDFNALGFEYGDSVNVHFSNGYQMMDIPYYNGYYAKTGEEMLVSYPGYEGVEACICNGDLLWDVAKVSINDTVSVERNQKGKYLDIQKELNIKYTDERGDYKSDEIFANFRNVKVGQIKTGILYRGASPIDNHHKRAKYADVLIKEAGVKYDIDLSDSDEDIVKHLYSADFESQYFKSLYDDKKYTALSMNMNYKSRDFAKKVVDAMTMMSKNEGPFYIHCVEGKDRTGFLLAVVEGLAGATYDEIVSDYMITYENYYGINEVNNKEKYDLIKKHYIDDMLKFLANYGGNTGNEDIDLKDLEWTNIVGRYLSDNGMSSEEIDNWYKNVTDMQ